MNRYVNDVIYLALYGIIGSNPSLQDSFRNDTIAVFTDDQSIIKQSLPENIIAWAIENFSSGLTGDKRQFKRFITKFSRICRGEDYIGD